MVSMLKTWLNLQQVNLGLSLKKREDTKSILEFEPQSPSLYKNQHLSLQPQTLYSWALVQRHFPQSVPSGGLECCLLRRRKETEASVTLGVTFAFMKFNDTNI